jgi:hypothetical protein
MRNIRWQRKHASNADKRHLRWPVVFLLGPLSPATGTTMFRRQCVVGYRQHGEREVNLVLELDARRSGRRPRMRVLLSHGIVSAFPS